MTLVGSLLIGGIPGFNFFTPILLSDEFTRLFFFVQIKLMANSVNIVVM